MREPHAAAHDGPCRVSDDAGVVELLAATGLTLTRPPSGPGPQLPLTWLALAARPHAELALSASRDARASRRGSLQVTVHVSQRVRLERDLELGEQLRAQALVIAARETARGLVGRVSTRFVAVGSPHPPLETPVAEVGSRFLITDSAASAASAEPGDARTSVPDAHPDPALDPGAYVWRFWTPDRASVAEFADLSGDRQALHLDEETARRAGYAGPLVHGSLIFAAVEAAASMGAAGARALSLGFEAPVVAGSAAHRIGVGALQPEQRGRDELRVWSAPTCLLDPRGRGAVSGTLEQHQPAAEIDETDA